MCGRCALPPCCRCWARCRCTPHGARWPKAATSPLPGRHDGAGRTGAARRPVRLGGVVRGPAGGSGRRLFDLVFLVGTLVTVFLSNDATAVVLTRRSTPPGRRAQSPYLFRLCLHRQCGQLRAAHFQSGQPGGVRPAHATAAAVAGAVALPSAAAIGATWCCAGCTGADRPAAGGRAGIALTDGGG